MTNPASTDRKTSRCELMMTQLTTAPWSTLHVSHFLRRIVTFLIIAPYKYSYLLTCTASINRSRSGHEVMTHDVLFGRDKVDEYFNGTAVEYRVADPLQLFIYTQPLVRLPLDASDQFLYLQLLRSNVPTPHTVFHKNALGPTTTCWRGGQSWGTVPSALIFHFNYCTKQRFERNNGSV